MATEHHVSALINHIASLDKVDMDRLTRSSLGEESLSSELRPRLKKIHRLKELSLQYAENVHDSALQSMQAVFSTLATQMTQQASRANPAFMAQKQAFLNGIDAQLEAAKQWEPFFIAGAIKARGFLEDEGIRKQHERTVSELKAEAQKTLDEVRNEAKHAIDEAKALADEIEQKARHTAAKVSVKEAQEQFKEAQKDLERKVTGWGWWSIVAIGVFA